MSQKLVIKLFGGFYISFDGKPATSMNSMRLQTLLAYLILHRDSPVSRQYLSFSLWPDSSESQARNNLRQVLHHLRQALPDADSCLQIETQTVHWNPKAPVSLDVAEFEQVVGLIKNSDGIENESSFLSRLETAVEIYRGDLFPECYDEWIEPMRRQFRKDYMTVLGKLAEHYESCRTYPKAIHYAEKLLNCDKLQEKTHLDLMRLHALNRERANSLKVYREYVELLERELGTEPGSKIKQFQQQLLENDQVPDSSSGKGTKEEGSLLPMVGRQNEWVRLRKIWKHILGGRSHLAIISGEAGIGKTRLAREMHQWVSRQSYITTTARCYEAEGSLAYAPINEWLSSENIRQQFGKLDEIYLQEITRLISGLLIEHPNLSPPAPITDSWQHRHFFESLARAILLPDKPMLLLIDDLQWCDPETLEWIHFLVRFASDRPMLVLGTVRVEEVDEDHPLRLLVKSLHKTDRVTEIKLDPLNAYETGILAEQVYGDDLKDTLRIRLFNETEGNPLFLVESVHAIIAGSDSITDESLDNQSQTLFAGQGMGLLPERVQSVIRSRFEMVSQEARHIGNYSAAIGRNFGIDLLIKSTGIRKEELIPVLEELLQRRIFREQGEGQYDFSHDKLREVSYSEMNQTKRHMVHEKIAHGLEEIHHADLESVSSQIAFHYENAGRMEKAVQYYELAANVAQRVYALEESTRLLNRALMLLRTLPENKTREHQELSMRLVLGPLLAAINGYHATEVGENNNHIQRLSHLLGQKVSTPVLRSIAISNVVQGDLEKAYGLGEQILQSSDKENQSVIESEGHYVAGVSSFWQGNFLRSRDHFIKAIDSFDPSQEQRHIDFYAQQPKIVCQIRLALTYLYLGFPEKAEQWFRHAIDDARSCDHPFSLAYALTYGAFIKSEFGEIEMAVKLADECVLLAESRAYKLWYQIASVFQSWTHFQMDGGLQNVEELQHRLERMRNSGIQLKSPYYANLLARSQLEMGYKESAMEAVEYAIDLVEGRGERWHLAEIYRIKGQILQEMGESPLHVEKWLKKAKEVAGAQGARMMELRAVRDLAKLWYEHDKSTGSLEQLREVYHQFTEGLERPDLRAADGLISKLKEDVRLKNGDSNPSIE